MMHTLRNLNFSLRLLLTTRAFFPENNLHRMKVLWTILLLSSCAVAQTRYETVEFSGKLIQILPGFGFAYELIEMETPEGINLFGFDPKYGETMVAKLQRGQEIRVKVKVNATFRDNTKRMAKDATRVWQYRFPEPIVEIFLDGQWQALTSQFEHMWHKRTDRRWRVFLEQTVQDDFFIDDLRSALVFANGLVAFIPPAGIEWRKSMNHVQVGNKVSFMGIYSEVKPGYRFPIDGVRKVYSYIPMKKTSGRIKSFIEKQNFVRLGLVINGIRLCFPTEYGEQIARFANKDNVTIWYQGGEYKPSNLLPTIHAIVHRGDTLLIEKDYWGGPDGEHEYQPIEFEGKISEVRRTEIGIIYSIFVGKEFYIEMPAQAESQIRSYLVTGRKIWVSGNERIRKSGEIYGKDVRLVTPARVRIDGREFIINQ